MAAILEMVMPVARKLWLPSLAVIPAPAARRRIIADALPCVSTVRVSRGRLCGPAGPWDRRAGRRRQDSHQVFLEVVMARHRVPLAPLLAQPHPQPPVLRENILDRHPERRAAPSEQSPARPLMFLTGARTRKAAREGLRPIKTGEAVSSVDGLACGEASLGIAPRIAVRSPPRVSAECRRRPGHR